MIHHLDDVVNQWTEFEGEPVTIRATVASEPEFGTDFGEKTLYRVRDTVTTPAENVFISFWHGQPELGGGTLDQTDPNLLELVLPEQGGTPLKYGEDVIIRGIPYESDNRRFINITSILLRQPDRTIGKGQMRFSNECDRLLHLLYVKQVYRPRDDYSAGPGGQQAFTGQIAHKALEIAVTEQPYQDYFEQDLWDDSAVESLVEQTLDREFVVQQALHSLRGTRKNDAVDAAKTAVMSVVFSDRFRELITDAGSLQTETRVARSFGFNGRVDLIVDGTPYDLKTGVPGEVDKFQLRLYLLSLLLEELEPGVRLADLLEKGRSGYILYTDDHDTVTFDEVPLEHHHVTKLLRLRNRVASVTTGFGVPSPYNEDCDGCFLRDEHNLSGLDAEVGTLPSACKHHCQSDRRWPCFEITDDDIATRCPLFSECDQRLEFRDPDIVDHYNRLRNALRQERTVRRDAMQAFERLSDTMLADTGLRLEGLEFSEIRSGRRIAYESADAVSAFHPGSTVHISTHTGDQAWTARYIGCTGQQFVFEFNDRVPRQAAVDGGTYDVLAAPQESTIPRRFMRQLDFAQRSGVDPRINTENDAISTDPDPDLIDLTTFNDLDYRELFIDVPVRPDRQSILADLAETIATATLPRLDDDGTVNYGEKRTLILSSSHAVNDAIHDRFTDRAKYVRFEHAAEDDHTLPGSKDQHEIKEQLEESRYILSTTQFAIQDEFFHYLDTYDDEARPHSTRFFDTVILFGADSIAEPTYHFLSKVADRTVAIGDTARANVDMISKQANNEGLADPYFQKAFERYSFIDADQATSLRVEGSANTQAVDILDDDRLIGDEGSMQFRESEGSEVLTTEQTTVSTLVDSGSTTPREIVFELADPSSDALDISSIFSEYDTFEMEGLSKGQVIIVNDVRLRCLSVNGTDNTDAGAHTITIQVPISTIPQFTELLLTNPKEAKAAVAAAIDQEADRIVTPFAAQARLLRVELAEQDTNIPVLLPADISGNVADTAVVSMVVANEDQLVHPPLSDFETIYTLLTAGRDVIVVGNPDTLRSNQLLQKLT